MEIGTFSNGIETNAEYSDWDDGGELWVNSQKAYPSVEYIL